MEREGAVAATEVRRDSTLGAGLDRDFDTVFGFFEVAGWSAFTFKRMDLARSTEPLAAFFVTLGFALAFVAIACGTYKCYCN